MTQMTPSNGIRVTLIELVENRTQFDEIKFRGSRYFLTVEEVLKHFGVELKPGQKVWIKRRDTTECRQKDFEKAARLEWEPFNNCIMAIARERPSGVFLVTFNDKPNLQKTGKTPEEDLKEQIEIWRENKAKKDEKISRVPRSVEIRRQKYQVVVRKKMKIRAEKARREKELSSANTDENKKENPEN